MGVLPKNPTRHNVSGSLLQTPQHKDDTIPRHNQQGDERLLSAVRAAWPTPLNCKTAALRARVSYDRARHVLPMLVRRGKLSKPRHGWYTLPRPPDADVDLRIENVALVARRHKIPPQGGRAVYQAHVDVLTRRTRMPGWNGAPKTDLRTFFKVYPVYVQDFDSGSLAVQIGAKGGPSMSMADFIEFCGWLQGKWEDIPDDGPTGWRVRSFELNHTFQDLRLDGPRSVSLRVFRNALVKFYQKPTGLRVELKPTHVDVPLAQLLQFAEDLARVYLRAGLIDVQEVKEP